MPSKLGVIIVLERSADVITGKRFWNLAFLCNDCSLRNNIEQSPYWRDRWWKVTEDQVANFKLDCYACRGMPRNLGEYNPNAAGEDFLLTREFCWDRPVLFDLREGQFHSFSQPCDRCRKEINPSASGNMPELYPYKNQIRKLMKSPERINAATSRKHKPRKNSRGRAAVGG